MTKIFLLDMGAVLRLFRLISCDSSQKNRITLQGQRPAAPHPDGAEQSRQTAGGIEKIRVDLVFCSATQALKAPHSPDL